MYTYRVTFILSWIGLSVVRGEDYLLAFPGSPYRDVGQPYVRVSGGHHGSVTTINTGHGVFQNITVGSFQSKEATDSTWITSHGIDNKSLLVSTDSSDVSVYGSLEANNRKVLSPLPVGGLGTRYTVVNCEELGPMDLLIATHTEEVEITVTFKFRYRLAFLSLNGADYHTGESFKISLMKYQTYTFQSEFEFTGTTITSSSTVAVFLDYESFIQLIPDKLYGFEFVISKALISKEYQKLQITSYQPNTQVLFNNGSLIFLPQEGTYRRRFEYNDSLYFTSDKPISVSTCSEVYYLDIAPPTNMFPSSCMLPKCPSPQEIIILSFNTTNVDHDISTSSISWSAIPGSGYQLGRANVSTSSAVHLVTSMSKFNVLAYCPRGPLFTYCGFNISKAQSSTNIDPQFLSSKEYLFAIPGTEPLGINTVTGEQIGTVQIQTPPNFETTFHVESYTSQYRSSLAWLVSDGLQNKTSTVKTSSSVNAFGGFGNKRIEYTPLEIDALGKKYTVINCEPGTDVKTVLVFTSHQFAVEINLTLLIDDILVHANKSYRKGDGILLNMGKYQTFFLTADSDMTGSVITSNETIAVFVGHMKAGKLEKYKQLIPQIHSGCDFIAPPTYSGGKTTSLLVISEDGDVQIRFSTNVKVEMKDGGFYKQALPPNEVVSFKTSKPVLAATCSAEGALSLLPPMHLLPYECCVPECPYAHGMTAVMKNNDSLSYRNSTVLQHVSRWTSIPGSDYKISYYTNDPGNALCFSSEKPFLVLISCQPSSTVTPCGLNFSTSKLQCKDFKDDVTPVTNDGSLNSLTQREYWMIGVGAAVLTLLITLMMVLPYCLWKRRNIFIMKLVYKFQAYEDDDDREFDAFISYCSTSEDEHFVVHTLFPKLEEWGFSTCVHFRDFMPGETIANNIIQAVENSRRTILLLSPSYIRSEFCQFEYQRAQHEMLKRKQRIIPIMFQDVTEAKAEMDQTLKIILNSITYIEWPGDGDTKMEQFWRKLMLSMPKRRPKDSIKL